MLGSLFAFAFLMGLKHALEADHVAAVLSLASGTRNVRRRVTVATAWGVGHAATLVGFGLLIAGLQIAVPDGVARALEAAVAATLIVLGLDVLRRLRKQRVHFHVHRHGAAPPHVHAHSHAGERTHDPLRHEHRHPETVVAKALLTGGVHGVAGSAALVLVSLATMRSALHAVTYVTVFALGTILGMVLLSLAVALPLRIFAPSVGATSRALDAALGMATVLLGCWILLQASMGSGPPG